MCHTLRSLLPSPGPEPPRPPRAARPPAPPGAFPLPEIGGRNMHGGPGGRHGLPEPTLVNVTGALDVPADKSSLLHFAAYLMSPARRTSTQLLALSLRCIAWSGGTSSVQQCGDLPTSEVALKPLCPDLPGVLNASIPILAYNGTGPLPHPCPGKDGPGGPHGGPHNGPHGGPLDGPGGIRDAPPGAVPPACTASPFAAHCHATIFIRLCCLCQHPASDVSMVSKR